VIYSLRQAAVLLGVSYSVLRRAVSEGRVTAGTENFSGMHFLTDDQIAVARATMGTVWRKKGGWPKGKKRNNC